MYLFCKDPLYLCKLCNLHCDVRKKAPTGTFDILQRLNVILEWRFRYGFTFFKIIELIKRSSYYRIDIIWTEISPTRGLLLIWVLARFLVMLWYAKVLRATRCAEKRRHLFATAWIISMIAISTFSHALWTNVQTEDVSSSAIDPTPTTIRVNS